MHRPKMAPLERRVPEGVDVVQVRYEQDPETAWWTATVPDVPAVVAQGKTLMDAHRQVRAALNLARGSNARPFFLLGETVWEKRDDLPPDAIALAKRESDLRIRCLDLQAQLDAATREAVTKLHLTRGFSLRVVARLLGITHQRVEQIAKSAQPGALSREEIEQSWAEKMAATNTAKDRQQFES